MTARKTTHPPRPATRRGRVLRTALAVGASLALLAACGGGGGGTSDAAGGGELDQVTFLHILPPESLTFAPEMIAEINGYFEQQRLDVQFETTRGSAPAIQTVIAGNALLTRVGDIETMIAAGERGAPLVAIGSMIKSGTIRMVSSRQAPLTQADQFRGKLIGTPSEGGTSEITVDLVAGSAGIPAEEVEKQVVGLSPGVFQLVQQGRVDAYVVSLDTSILLQNSQPDAVVYDPNDAVTAGKQLYATSTQQAQDPEKQDQLRRYLVAVRDAAQFIIDDADNGFAEVMRLIESEYDVPSLDDPEVARESLQTYVDSYTADGPLLHISTERWASTYEEVTGIGQVEPGLDPTAWITNDFVPQGSS
jgi:NitT/TauT family transport system substrate-binding protein